MQPQASIFILDSTSTKAGADSLLNMAGQDSAAGASVYTKTLLAFYDFWVLRVSNTFAWRCKTSSTLLPFFQKHLTSSHIDIGVGTGYYPAHAIFPSTFQTKGSDENPSITIVDLNPNSLASTQAQIQAKHPKLHVHAVQADVMALESLAERLPISVLPAKSISVFYLLHCLPGPASLKTAVLVRLGKLLAPDGTLYGATVLGKDVEHNWFGKFLMDTYNNKGIFGNNDDGIEDFVKPLEEGFGKVEWRVEGTVLLFTASSPRS